MSKIESMTAAQEQRMVAVRDEWLAIGRSTARVNKTKARKAIAAMYAAIGHEKPEVLFFSSPAMCLLAYGTLSQLGSQLG